MKRTFAPLLASSLVACGGADGPGPTSPPPDPTTFGVDDPGPFGCGHRVLEARYTPLPGRPERTLPVHVWYPTTATDGVRARYRGIFEDPLAWEDAPLAAPAWAGGFPVLAHSHGYMGFAGNSHRMMCHFAGHGWVAVAPEHVGNTLTDTPDPLPLAAFYQRPLDVRAAVLRVETLETPDPLAGKLDPTRLAVSGHSFGTFTVWALAGGTFDRAAIEGQCASGKIAACSEPELALFDGPLAEPRARTAIPMAGGKHAFFGASGLDGVKPPVLLMTGSLDDVGAAALFTSVSGVSLTWFDVEGGCHQLYGLGNTTVGEPACAALADEEGFAIVNPYALAHARYHVLEERGDVVRGRVEDGLGLSSRVQVERKTP